MNEEKETRIARGICFHWKNWCQEKKCKQIEKSRPDAGTIGNLQGKTRTKLFSAWWPIIHYFSRKSSWPKGVSHLPKWVQFPKMRSRKPNAYSILLRSKSWWLNICWSFSKNEFYFCGFSINIPHFMEGIWLLCKVKRFRNPGICHFPIELEICDTWH